MNNCRTYLPTSPVCARPSRMRGDIIGVLLLGAAPYAEPLRLAVVPAESRIHKRARVSMRVDKPFQPRTATPSVLERASGFLGRLAADAFNRTMASDPNQPIPTKEFCFSATVRHVRDIEGPLTEYMKLPIDQYALYDAKLMKRIDRDTFELSLPLKGSAGGTEQLKPTLRVRVKPEPDENRLRIQSIGASLYGLEPNGSRSSSTREGAARNGSLFSFAIVQEEARPASAESGASSSDDASAASNATNGTARSGFDAVNGEPPDASIGAANSRRLMSGLEKGLRSADLGFNTTLTWRGGLGRSKGGERGNFTRLGATVRVQLRVSLPPPFTLVPRLIVQSAAGVIMRSITELVVPQFVNLLESDYKRWLNGTTRDMEGVNGTLLEETEVLTASAAAEGDLESDLKF